MPKSSNRKSRERKERQADAQYITSLRQRVKEYESYGDAEKMSKERMEFIIKNKKRRFRLPGADAGLILAMAAMGELNGKR